MTAKHEQQQQQQKYFYIIQLIVEDFLPLNPLVDQDGGYTHSTLCSSGRAEAQRLSIFCSKSNKPAGPLSQTVITCMLVMPWSRVLLNCLWLAVSNKQAGPLSQKVITCMLVMPWSRVLLNCLWLAAEITQDKMMVWPCSLTHAAKVCRYLQDTWQTASPNILLFWKYTYFRFVFEEYFYWV